jgi:cytoskeletal protein RodZ
MRKYRSWLMGLGIGLIIGASMLQMILIAKDQAGSLESTLLTRAQLDTEAQKAGLVLLTQEQLDVKLNEAARIATEKAKSTAKSEDPANSPKVSVQPSVKTDADKTAQSTDTASAEAPQAVTLYIPKGMNFSEAADKLEELGVVADANDFIDKAWSIQNKLGVGTAVFTDKMTYRQIMTELTRSKEH